MKVGPSDQSAEVDILLQERGHKRLFQARQRTPVAGVAYAPLEHAPLCVSMSVRGRAAREQARGFLLNGMGTPLTLSLLSLFYFARVAASGHKHTHNPPAPLTQALPVLVLPRPAGLPVCV